MGRNLRRIIKGVSAGMLVASLTASVILSPALNVYAANNNTSAMLDLAEEVSILESLGWLEAASIEWNKVKDATGYNVYYKSIDGSDSTYKQLDNELIREYPTYFRADILGLEEGNYVVKIVPLKDGEEIRNKAISTKVITVKPHVREGFAFSKESPMGTSSGGYSDNGTVSENAKIVYISKDTINTVQLDVVTNKKGTITNCTGLTNILAARQKGYDKSPLIIRMIGEIKASDIQGLNSAGYIQIKGAYNVTFEGIGEDATINGWGLLVRDSHNVEIRNLGVMLFTDDALSLDTNNENIWIHNNDIFYGTAGSDADQAKGDGSTDVKAKSTYVTLSYNHYYDSGKSSLCGMSDTEEFFVTYHHNWFDHSDSRHPRIRVGTVHVYNNYFDGNSKYGVGVTKASSAFVEANYYRNCKYPMMTSMQGTDIYGGSKGTFSGEEGGMIKAYNNVVIGASRLVYANQNSKQFDAYLANSRAEVVPSTYKTVSGGNTYNNFDTSEKMYDYTPDAAEDVKDIVTTYAGRVNGGDFTWEFTEADDVLYSVNQALMSKIKAYKSTLVSFGGNSTIGSLEGLDDIPEIYEPSEETPEETPDNNEDVEVGALTHDFTANGKESDMFTIKGSLSDTKGTVEFNGLKLTQCLKIDSAAAVNFETKQKSTLTLVFNSNFNKTISIDGEKYKAINGVINIELEAGNHTIVKGDTSNLYYIEVKY